MKEKTTTENQLRYILYVSGIIIVATVLCFILSRAGVENESFIMVYIIGVLLSTAVTKGYVYGVITAVLGLLCYNYYFAYPYFSLRINDIQDAIMLCLFLITAIIGGGMASRYKTQSRIAEKNEETTRMLYEITESFVDITGFENIVNTAMKYIHDLTGYSCEVNIDGEIYFFGTETDTVLYAPHEFPVKGKSDHPVTVTVYAGKITQDHNKIINSVVHQTALVLDREAIYTEREKYRLDIETERLKSTLLRSISHDIRTPLTGILGASNIIVQSESVLEKSDMVSLAKDITEETEWLIMTVQNILNMTRLSENTLSLQKETELADELILQATTRISRMYPEESAHLKTVLPEELLFVNVDGPLMVSVLTNLLDNAFRHAGDYTAVTLRAYAEGENAVFEVSDDGRGIDEDLLGNIFDGFVTVKTRNSDKGRGMGLGLSICRAIVSAHGGTISAENGQKGSIFRVTLPKEGEE